ncbi:hypothetical protein PU560_17580 [Georgenia sp. 10Sc9-8]|uniref:DUF8094 domain-containing protein n=1 Tax=Georgenia halotolerans TaxID=3028317 RepID=A0ABT5U2W3_9MICO|nr:hypothetical protein [Georgenia halotolerans]
MTAKATRVLAAGALSLALVGACTEPVPEPDPDPTAETAPAVLDPTRLEAVLGDVQETLDAGDDALDPEVLQERVTGPALRMRTAEYELARATDGENEPTPLTMDTQVEVVAASDTFPRSVIAVSEIPEGANLPLITGLRQEAAREQYRLWAWARAFPGVEIPATVVPEVGSPELGPDAEELAATPAEALSSYVARLDDPESEGADRFTDDPFTQEYRSWVSDLNEEIEVAGEVEAAAQVGEGGVLALSTADGGALVLGELGFTRTLRKTVEDATLEAGGAIGDLLGEETEVQDEVSATYVGTVALHIPPAGEGATIEVLGAEAVLADVARSGGGNADDGNADGGNEE